MSEQKNISTKKMLRFTVGALLVVVFMVALIAASRQQNNKAIKGLEVHLNDEKEYSFLQRKDIENLLLRNRHIDLARTSIANLDLRLMEDIARTNPWVAKADIYVDNRQVLQVSIVQREPMARIFDVNGATYYIDSTLHTMPVSQGYAYPAPVFTNVPVVRNDSINKVLLRKITRMSDVLGKDSFWHAQITQVEVQPDQTFVLIPLMGNQRILAGDTAAIETKLKNLLAFYKNVSNKVGWDKYETLDLRFKGQVVASPSIGWIPPKVTDTAAITIDVPATAPGATEAPAATKPTTTHTAATPTATVVPAAAKPVTTAPAKQVVKPAAAKTVTAPKVQRATTAAKPKPVVPAAHKAKETTVKKEAKKEQKKETKPKDKTPSPKYIYPGKHSGNH
jgi:cell division protein FtsQ